MASGDDLGALASQVTLNEIKDNLGSPGDTGGSTTAGTVDAKLNAILALTSKLGVDENGLYVITD